MTLIALLHKNSFPMAITDNLISTSDKVKDYHTPDTPLDTKEILDSENQADNFYILGMANKIWKENINGKYLFLLYAGTVRVAKEIFEEYCNKISYCQSANDLENVFKDLDSQVRSKYSQLDTAGIFLYNDNGIIYSHDFGEINHLGFSNDSAATELSLNIAISAGSGSKTFLKLIMNVGTNKSLCRQLEFVYNHLNGHKPNLGDYYNQCVLFALNSVALCTTEAMLRPDYSQLTQNACGALYNLRHFVELYPSIPADIIKIFDTGLCQIFTEKDTGDGIFISKFILTNYTDDLTVSFVLNEHIDITNYLKLNNFQIRIEKDKFNVFEIGNRYKETIKRKIVDSDAVLLKSNQLITYAYKHNQKSKYRIHVKPVFWANEKLVSCTIIDNYVEISISHANEDNEKMLYSIWK